MSSCPSSRDRHNDGHTMETRTETISVFENGSEVGWRSEDKISKMNAKDISPGAMASTR